MQQSCHPIGEENRTRQLRMSQATTVAVPPEFLDVTVHSNRRVPPSRDQSSGHVQSRTLTVSCGLGTKIVEVLLSVVRKNPKSCWSQLKCPRCALQQRIRLDDIDLSELFTCRASVMQSVPRFLWGSFRVALKVALDEIIAAVSFVRGEGGSCCCYCLACCCTDLVGEVL